MAIGEDGKGGRRGRASTSLRNATSTSMVWFLIEAGVALLLLIFIVWWTVPRRKDGKKRNGSGPGAER